MLYCHKKTHLVADRATYNSPRYQVRLCYVFPLHKLWTGSACHRLLSLPETHPPAYHAANITWVIAPFLPLHFISYYQIVLQTLSLILSKQYANILKIFCIKMAFTKFAQIVLTCVPYVWWHIMNYANSFFEKIDIVATKM